MYILLMWLIIDIGILKTLKNLIELIFIYLFLMIDAGVTY